jgi:multicomponent Na+:H+ antiporter subunit E
VVLGLLWIALAGDFAAGWIIGLPSVLVAAAWSARRNRSATTPWRPGGIAVFVPYFLFHSVASGLDVAVRALRPDMRLHPGFIRYKTCLPDGAPRRLFLNTVTLMPGTLSTVLEGAELVVHVLDADGPVQASLRQLERRVAACFAVNQGMDGK